MTTCAFCSQPLHGDDRFCTGCGKAVPTSSPSAFPAAVDAAAAAAATTGFRWKWALLTIPIAVGTAMLVAFTAGIVMGALGAEWQDGPREDGIVAVIVLGSMVLAGLIVGWFSPGRTLYEPGVGLAAAIAAMSVVFGDPGGVLMGWLIPFALGVGGAWVGEWLQGRCAAR